MIQHLPQRWKTPYAKLWFGENKRRRFYLKVAELSRHGIKIDQIITSLHNRSLKKRNGKNSVEAYIYSNILRGLGAEGQLSSGTKPFVPSIDNLLIQSGEKSGRLTSTLESAASLNEKMSKVKGLVRKALAYPVFLVFIIIVVICWFGSNLFPTMEDFLPIDQWPALSKNVYGLSLFFIDWYFLVIAFFGLIFGLIWMSFSKLTGPIRIKLDKIPPWSLYRLSQGGAWMLSISSMVSAGIMNIEALTIIHKEAKNNPWLRERTKAVHDNISRSQSMGQALTTKFNFPDKEICEDMIDYSISPDFNKIFEAVGKNWIDESMDDIAEQTSVLKNVSTAIALVFLGAVAKSVISLMMAFTGDLSMSGM